MSQLWFIGPFSGAGSNATTTQKLTDDNSIVSITDSSVFKPAAGRGLEWSTVLSEAICTPSMLTRYTFSYLRIVPTSALPPSHQGTSHPVSTDPTIRKQNKFFSGFRNHPVRPGSKVYPARFFFSAAINFHFKAEAIGPKRALVCRRETSENRSIPFPT